MLSSSGAGGLENIQQAQKGEWKKRDGSFHSFEMFVFSDFEFYEVNTHLVLLTLVMLLI